MLHLSAFLITKVNATLITVSAAVTHANNLSSRLGMTRKDFLIVQVLLGFGWVFTMSFQINVLFCIHVHEQPLSSHEMLTCLHLAFLTDLLYLNPM